jgi:spore germination cell wall hydrolase CwlJ-like protein
VYYPRRDRCQFSWYCDGKPDEIISKKNNIAWRMAQDVAIEVMAFDKYNGIVEGATHYHADYVDPAWNKTITLVTHIDDHIFYRWD